MNKEDKNKKAQRACAGCLVIAIAGMTALPSMFMVEGATGSLPAALGTAACIVMIGVIVAYKIVKK